MNAPAHTPLQLEPDLAPDLALDIRALGIRLSECERALLECQPVVCHDASYAKLFALGIHGDGVCGRWFLDALHVAPVVFLSGSRFEFSSNLSRASGHVAAVIIPARDEAGDLVDLAAWLPDDGALALWRGRVSMLGDDSIFAPRILSPALSVFADVAAWLRAGRHGVVVIDPAHARWRLAGVSLSVADAAHGRRLARDLALPRPQIFVIRASIGEAA
jgi:hypothetical protein